jgi:hypothetical protein
MRSEFWTHFLYLVMGAIIGMLVLIIKQGCM